MNYYQHLPHGQVRPDEAPGQRGHEEEQGDREHGGGARPGDPAALHRGDLRRVQRDQVCDEHPHPMLMTRDHPQV